ncbi:MAG: hypothetical protein GY917_24005, partial [Planctomycetaceae bacterium]|nr:hypothetical protein [Planctomycetaceae bacterium]
MLGPSAQRIYGDPGEVCLPSRQDDVLIELREPIAAHGSASLLLAGPQFLLTGNADPFLAEHHDRHVIHQLLESLLPNGILVFAELLNLDGLPATGIPASLPTAWEQAIGQTD